MNIYSFYKMGKTKKMVAIQFFGKFKERKEIQKIQAKGIQMQVAINPQINRPVSLPSTVL